MIKIEIGNLESLEVKKLLQEHHNDMLNHSPTESVHALDLLSLKEPSITFLTAWVNGKLAGCGAYKKINEKHIELKSMRTSSSFLRKGVAAKLLTYILATAKEQHFERVSLETGTANAFLPAQVLYKSFDFQECEPFSNYQKDPFSLFLTKVIG